MTNLTAATMFEREAAPGNNARVRPVTDLREATLNRISPLLEFPAISWDEFQALPSPVREDILLRNRIISTDTYNRTMAHLAGCEKAGLESKLSPEDGPGLIAVDQGSYTLQLRRAPHGFLIACGIEDLAEEFSSMRISEAELNFAKEYYRHAAVPFFNERIWEWVVHENDGKLPFEIRGLRDGHVVAPGEPVMTVSGPSELIAHFEHRFHRVFYGMLVAAQAKVLSDIVGDPARFIEVGLRGAYNDEQHYQALKAGAIGGGFMMTSNDAGVGLQSMRDVGTIGHRYIQRFESEEAAYRFAIENLPAVTLLVDLVDTYQGLDLALKLKQEYRSTGKPIFVRLDSGDLLDQARYYLRRADKFGFSDARTDKIVIEGMDSLEEIREIESALVAEFGEAVKHRIVYGAGSLLISDRVSRSDASTGFKLGVYTDRRSGRLEPTMKFSNSRGKESYPGRPELGVLDGERCVAQAGEDGFQSAFELLFAFGESAARSTLQEAQSRVRSQFPGLRFRQVEGAKRAAERGAPSPETEALRTEIRGKYGLAA